MLDDHDIIALVRNGDSNSFGGLVERYQSIIGRYLFRLTGDYQIAQDLSQETFIKAFEAIPKTNSELQFKPWLFRIATNNANQYFRRKKILSFIPLSDSGKQEQTSNIEESDCAENKIVIEDILLKIPEKRRTCMLMHFVEGLKYEEIGSILGITAQAVRKRVFRGSEEFKKLVQEYGGMKI